MRAGDTDVIEVSRAAHELSERHGRDAHLYAEKFAEQAARAGRSEEHAFWLAAAAMLRPRGDM